MAEGVFRSDFSAPDWGPQDQVNARRQPEADKRS